MWRQLTFSETQKRQAVRSADHVVLTLWESMVDLASSLEDIWERRRAMENRDVDLESVLPERS